MLSSLHHLYLRRALVVSATVITSSSLLFSSNSSSASNKSYTDKNIPTKDKKIVIAGGGIGGRYVAEMLQANGYRNVTIIEPKSIHYYQALTGLVGSCSMWSILPTNTQWIQRYVKSFHPKQNNVELSDGTKVSYDYLIVAVGIVPAFNKIPGAVEALQDEDSGVVSVYDYYDGSIKTARILRNFREGRAIFTMSTTPFMWPWVFEQIIWILQCKIWDKNLRDKVSIEFWVPTDEIISIPECPKILTKMANDRHIVPNFKKQLVSINHWDKTAVFYDTVNKVHQSEKFDLLHIVPPMYPPNCLIASPLSDTKGYVEVNKHTLQSIKYPNVFALGDCTTCPTGKTGVLIHNLEKQMKGEPLTGTYDYIQTLIFHIP